MNSSDTANRLQHLVHSEEDAKANPGAARGTHPRAEVRGEAELFAIDQSRPRTHSVSIQLRNVSMGGFGFISQEPLDVGSRWRALIIQRNQQVAEQAVQIRHCRTIERGLYFVGSQFCLDSCLIALLGLERAKL